jgi:23S rRNA pseudouridine1911/1915/1917 synthase
MEAPRHLLHASRLTLDHPVTGERITFESEMPGDMLGYVKKNQLN